MKKTASKTFNILSIETSCDETAVAVLEVSLGKQFPTTRTLSTVINSQIKLHSKMGGVVPEAAARAHVKNIEPATKQALTEAGLNLSDINYLAVTVGPGLIPSLLVGVEFTKALSFALNIPIIPVNHMLGHLYSPFSPIQAKTGVKPASLFPMISLIVSGGHTILALMDSEKKYKVLGETMDDAAGEAFDKVAKLLQLPYPGGPEVSKLALQGKVNINFPRPMINSKNFDFSFSGLKTAVRYYIEALRTKHLSLSTKSDICASFQQAAIDTLVSKTIRATEQFKAKSVSLSGGVAANKLLRDTLQSELKKRKIKFFVPPINLCTDNAEMIGLAAAFMLNNGFKPVSFKKVKADSNLSL